MPGMTGRYMIIKMSRRHREVVCKSINDSDYFKRYKTVTKLSNQSKSSKEEGKRSRREYEELLEFKQLLEEQLDDVNRQLEAMQKKDHHITDFTKRSAKLKSTDNSLRVRLDERKNKSREQNIVINNLQHLNEEPWENEILTDSKIATEKQLHVAEEVNSQLQTKLEEAEAEIKNLRTKNRELEKESIFLACARRNLPIYDNGMNDTLNERNCDLSDGEDNPPSENLIQSDMNYNNIVTGAETDNVGQNNDDHCWLSSDADKSEPVPASAYSIQPNGMALCV